MQAGSASKEKVEPEYEEDEVVVVGTSTVLDNSSEEDTTSLSSLQKGKEQLKNVENAINTVSHKMKSNKNFNLFLTKFVDFLQIFKKISSFFSLLLLK